MERATLRSGGDGGGRTGSNCGGCGERATLVREVEPGANVVDVDEFWPQEESRRVFIMWLFLKAWVMRKYAPRVVLHHTIHRDA